MQFSRFLETTLQEASSRGKARLVLGARQTGKSTLFRMMIGPGDLLIDLQERSERMRLMRDPGAFTRSLLPVRGHRHVLVDEIQRVPELLDEIQILLDRHPGKLTFTLTGSSARRLRRGRTNLLPGRIHRHMLAPVCAWEQEIASESATVLPPPRPSAGPRFPDRPLEEMLVLGNLPAAFIERDRFGRTLESYAESYIEEEVLREMAARNLGDYGRFLELAAIESGKPINLTKVSQESGIALSTLRGFYSVLEDTLIGFSVLPFSKSGRARVLKRPKFYFFDVGVRNAVARLPLDPRILATEGGHLFEHWVGCELMARIGYLERSFRLSSWRTVDGAEVDFVLETPSESIPIEAKLTASPRPEDARGIERFLDRYGKYAKRGFVVCRASRAEQLSPRVRAIPWHYL